jgi:hypothetical protein
MPKKYRLLLAASLLCFSAINAPCQTVPDAPSTLASISGTVTDVDGYLLPDTTIAIDGPTPQDHRTMVSDDHAIFTIEGLRSGVSYHLSIHAKGFADWTSGSILLTPGQRLDLNEVKLTVGDVMTTVSAVSAEKVALEQVQNEEKQRVFGFIPNFYVVYDQRFVPLTPKLKFQLAYRSATDVVTFGSALFLAGIDQAAVTPKLVEGTKGYGQRVGIEYANAATNIMLGGAILPTLFHQDPRYFYQGTGSNRSRLKHALSAPFVAKGDNGHWQPNYSSLGGDLASNALANIYYPPADRGLGLVLGNAAISTAGRMVNAVVQEFLLRKFTTNSKGSE